MSAITAAVRAYRIPRWLPELIVLAVAIVLYAVFHGQGNLPHDDEAKVFGWLNDARDWVDDNHNSSPFFIYGVNYVRLGIDDLVTLLLDVLHGMGWAGVTATAGAAGLVLAGWRVALVTVAGFLSFGVLGLWEHSIDTLALTISAVLLSLLIGVPLGVLAGRSARVQRMFNPVLDLMQIMPTFAYLAPLALFFQIGPPAAVVATMIYSIPPAIRITALGIRQVQAETVEAAVSLGSTRWQTLRKVQLPMAKSTIVLAINQTIMMALAMVVITALIDAPGLGEDIFDGLERHNVGIAFDAGLAIVIMAIVLDRLTRGASKRAEVARRSGREVPPKQRWALLGFAGLVAAAGIIAGRVMGDREEFPEGLQYQFASPVNSIVEWITDNLADVTDAIKNAVSDVLLNPLQDVLTLAPWWLIVGTAFLIGLRLSGLRAALTAAGCLIAVALAGLWEHSMITLATVLVGTIITLTFGVALGIAAARSDAFSQILRPALDAAQTMPSFVYLVPAVALFSAGRFTAIVAAVIYAFPPVVRLVEDGIRGVPATAVEAATAAGSTSGQILWKVQLPMARRALLLAANQGIVLVLAMVVVGGLIGAGGLGFDVVSGFSQQQDFGMGLAAGLATVALGVMLDRLTQSAGGRSAAVRASQRGVS